MTSIHQLRSEVAGSFEAYFESPVIYASMRERERTMKLDQIKTHIKDRGGMLSNQNALVLIAEIERLQSSIAKDSSAKIFYIQSSGGCVGNEALWWKTDGAGYTTHLSEAGKFTASQAAGIHNSRKSDVPWLCSEVDDIAHWTVDVGFLRKLG